MTELSLKAAALIVEAALKRGRELDCKPLAVAVLDAGGTLKAFQREDGASTYRPAIATAKAAGAVGMGRSTRDLAGLTTTAPHFLAAVSALTNGNLVPVPGGVLIRDADGAMIGAVGISGDTSDRDEDCAVAGIKAAGLTAGV